MAAINFICSMAPAALGVRLQRGTDPLRRELPWFQIRAHREPAVGSMQIGRAIGRATMCYASMPITGNSTPRIQRRTCADIPT